MARFKRILLKLSGESLMGEKQYGIDEKRLGEYAQQIKEIHDLGVQIGIVIGGGNIFRGASQNSGIDREQGDLWYRHRGCQKASRTLDRARQVLCRSSEL